MPVIVSPAEVQRQSEQVFAQFGEKIWIPNAKKNVELKGRKEAKDLMNTGIGKFLVLCAMGESLTENVDTIIKYRDRLDVVTCDKGFGPLLDHGVKADYVMICDANIPFKYIEKYVDQTEGVKLISTPYANPEWTHAWKGEKYFYINRDSINSERIFLKIFPSDTRIIPAGSNVSNAMLVFFTGSDMTQNLNWSGYDKFFLVGYDYSWKMDGQYYSWLDPKPKRFYMNHRTVIDMKSNVCFTSENLLFSAKWLYSYVTNFNLPVVNCSGRGLLNIKEGTLENELSKINPDRKERSKVREVFDAAKDVHKAANSMRELFEKTREVLYVSR